MSATSEPSEPHEPRDRGQHSVVTTDSSSAKENPEHNAQSEKTATDTTPDTVPEGEKKKRDYRERGEEHEPKRIWRELPSGHPLSDFITQMPTSICHKYGSFFFVLCRLLTPL